MRTSSFEVGMSNSAHGSSSAQATTGARPQFGDLWNEFACASGAGLAILDEQLRYVAVNDPLAQMNGIPAAAHIGNSIHDLLGESARELEPALRRVLGEGRPVLNYDWNARLRGRDHAGSW